MHLHVPHTQLADMVGSGQLLEFIKNGQLKEWVDSDMLTEWLSAEKLAELGVDVEELDDLAAYLGEAAVDELPAALEKGAELLQAARENKQVRACLVALAPLVGTPHHEPVGTCHESMAGTSAAGQGEGNDGVGQRRAGCEEPIEMGQGGQQGRVDRDSEEPGTLRHHVL